MPQCTSEYVLQLIKLALTWKITHPYQAHSLADEFATDNCLLYSHMWIPLI